MKKRVVTTGKEFAANDFNLSGDYMEENIQNLILDLQMTGFLYGGACSEDDPQSLSVVLEPSAIYDYQGKRIYVNSDLDIDFTDIITATGDPGGGNEYYVTAVLSHGYIESDPYMGTTTNRIYSDSYSIEFLAGSIATTGNAVKPTIAVDQNCVCDILVTPALYAASVITDLDIDDSRLVQSRFYL